MTQLTPHFAQDELTRTTVEHFSGAMEPRIRAAIAHMPPTQSAPSPTVLTHLKATAAKMEDVRGFLGNRAIYISSGYRTAEVNAAVGGDPASAHMDGDALDFTCPGFGSPLAVCHALATSGLSFDVLTWERTWVHLSFAAAMRGLVQTDQGGGIVSGLPPL